MPLKVGEVIKLIETDGWYLVATKGSQGPEHPEDMKLQCGLYYGLMIVSWARGRPCRRR